MPGPRRRVAIIAVITTFVAGVLFLCSYVYYGWIVLARLGEEPFVSPSHFDAVQKLAVVSFLAMLACLTAGIAGVTWIRKRR